MTSSSVRPVLLVFLLALEAALCLFLLSGQLVAERVVWIATTATIQLTLALGLATAIAAALLGGASLRPDLQHWLDRFRQAQRSWLFLVLHLGAFLAFVGVTLFVPIYRPTEAESSLNWLAAAWAALAAAALVFWIVNAIPPRLWQLMTRNGLDLIAAGLVLAVVAVAVARLSRYLWEPLGHSTLWTVHQVLCLLYTNVVYKPDEAVVGTPACSVTIAVGCGGYEGIGLNAFFLLVYVWVFRRELRWPAILLLFPLGAGLMWLSNLFRIVALIALGDRVSLEVAVKGFHSQAGWLLFAAISLGMIAVSRRMRFFTVAEPVESKPATPGPAAAAPVPSALPYLAPFLALLATIMLTAAFSSGFDWLYPVRVLIVAPLLWFFRREYAAWSWRWSWEAAAVGVGVFVLWMALEPWAADPKAEAALVSGLNEMPDAWRIVWLVFRVLGSVVTVPMVEELAFRGYLTRRLIAADVQDVPLGQFSWFSFIVSSVLFGLLHGRWFAGTLAGMAFALMLYRRRCLVDAILAHAVANALIAATVLLGGRWSLWA